MYVLLTDVYFFLKQAALATIRQDPTQTQILGNKNLTSY